MCPTLCLIRFLKSLVNIIHYLENGCFCAQASINPLTSSVWCAYKTIPKQGDTVGQKWKNSVINVVQIMCVYVKVIEKLYAPNKFTLFLGILWGCRAANDDDF